VRIYDENDIEMCVVLRSFDDTHAHRSDLTELAFSPELKLVTTVSVNRNEGIRMWDADTGKCEMMIKTPDCEVTALRFLADYPAVAVASSDGRVRVWGAAESSQYRGVCVLEFFNAPPAGAALEELDEDEATMWIRPLLLPMVLRADEAELELRKELEEKEVERLAAAESAGPAATTGEPIKTVDQQFDEEIKRRRARQAGLAASAVPQPEPILFPKPWEKYQPRLPVLAAEDRRGLPEAVSPHPIAVTSLAFVKRGAK